MLQLNGNKTEGKRRRQLTNIYLIAHTIDINPDWEVGGYFVRFVMLYNIAGQRGILSATICCLANSIFYWIWILKGVAFWFLLLNLLGVTEWRNSSPFDLQTLINVRTSTRDGSTNMWQLGRVEQWAALGRLLSTDFDFDVRLQAFQRMDNWCCTLKQRTY